jgi:acetyl-CoA hydrolase
MAVQAIKSHDRIFMTGNCSVPKELLSALIRRAAGTGRRGDRAGADDRACRVRRTGDGSGHLRANSLFISQNVRKAASMRDERILRRSS